MTRAAIVACLFAAGCESRGVARGEPVGPLAARDWHCTLRVAKRGLYVDGDPSSLADAIGYCKVTAGAIVVVEDNAPCSDWEPIRSALVDQGVRIYMRGPLIDPPWRPPIRVSVRSKWEPIVIRCK